MSTFHSKHVRHAARLFAITAVLSAALHGQNSDKQEPATIQGTVCDAQNQPVPDAIVSLETQKQAPKLVSHTDSQGHYRFEAVPAGTYTLHAKAADYQETREGPIAVRANETKSIVLQLSATRNNAPGKDASASIEFSDEPKFTVAGVTDPTNLGGHGSDVVLRTKETLAKDTASLKQAEPEVPATTPHDAADTSELHARRGDIAESEGRPLEAVQEYQRAAEMNPSEPHLFAWGAELLLHRAFEPSIEVFTKGRALYPHSVRILLGLSVATYSRGLNDKASRLFLAACDMDPKDPTPYLFLGRLQESEKIEPPGWTERLQRFVNLHPENALAHYYYSVSLAKQASQHPEHSATVESELNKAIELDPQLGRAYLQLGILYSEKKEFPQAISAFQKAIEVTPFPDEAHYRLAQVYRQTGEPDKARREIEVFNKVSQQKTDGAERERHGIQQFVYTLKDQSAPSRAPALKPQ
jgi:tetratricopeptide (TPR) repeat protein